MNKFCTIVQVCAVMVAGTSFSMDGSLLSEAMLFPRNSICRTEWSDLSEIENRNVERFKYVFDRLIEGNVLKDLQRSGLVDRLYMEGSGVLPIRLPMDDIQKILGKHYPEGVFHDFNPSDLSIVSRIFPSLYDINLYGIGYKSSMLGCVAGVIRLVVDKLGLKATHDEIEDFCLKIPVYSVALVLNERTIYRPLKVNTADCLEAIRQLFPEGMFHKFNDIEILLMAHLFPKNIRINENDLNFFTECLIGVMRTLVIRDFRSTSERKALLQQYLNLESSSSAVPSFHPLGTVNEVACRTVSGACIVERLVPLYSPKEISAQDREAIQNAFKEVAYSDGISIDADCALRVWNSLAPRGIFHIFSQKEAVLLNFMQPIDLSAEGRLIWMKLLAGSYKSMFFTKNISHPLSNELMENLKAII